MAKKTTQNLKSEVKLTKGGLTVFDALFIISWLIVSFFFSYLVDSKVKVLYWIFTVLVGIFLTSRSKLNLGRRNIESIYFLLSKDFNVYRPYFRSNEDDI